jgi:hypothetical protein
MLNPDSDGMRFLGSRPLVKNVIFHLALDNYAFEQAAKREAAARVLEEAAAQDEANEQFMLVPPKDYDVILTEYINLDVFADGIAERQAKAYSWYDMDDDDDYY